MSARATSCSLVMSEGRLAPKAAPAVPSARPRRERSGNGRETTDRAALSLAKTSTSSSSSSGGVVRVFEEAIAVAAPRPDSHLSSARGARRRDWHERPPVTEKEAQEEWASRCPRRGAGVHGEGAIAAIESRRTCGGTVGGELWAERVTHVASRQPVLSVTHATGAGGALLPPRPSR